MTTIEREPQPDIVPTGEVRAAIALAIHVIGRAANALILGLERRTRSPLAVEEDAAQGVTVESLLI